MRIIISKRHAGLSFLTLAAVVALPIMDVSFQLAMRGRAAFAAERMDPAYGLMHPAGQRR